ncbi:acetylornithine carbamoyltransferase [Pedobacter heparinus]|uniref:N-succinylornithine carbamoyltransferase n=1 Tax=Pedobacter heparinus (strain ATCC 13125 / DSM 2366 / CIP 104194 / JCM 7457 / NBRC 12017 / NCIMB 9290 / NRRL B-14731 / HIM 762-3) TaxID=485917 RepID=C6XX91_PEDHD|nr:acetylornithine carbamoyltransferase [Pedobacter heparinus]ACU06397.1 N-acetylornithine carbamoyltransferase [Pedobacter heparinus DSM 2366]
MNQFTSVNDVQDIGQLVKDALALKENPYAHQHLGKNKTLGLVFLNPSLRTRLSAQKAALNLGMNVMVMNMDKEGWALETQDGVVMNGTTVEHIREAAAVMGQYCDVLGLRSFPKLLNRDEDYNEDFFNKFIKYCKVPVVSLESATRHPLQSLADLVTIKETWKAGGKPKVVLAWAPHIKALPQAVPNSFAEWMCKAQEEGMLDFTIAQPKGYELSEDFTPGANITYNLDEALAGADYIYVKNWSSYKEYGKVLTYPEGWMLNNDKLKETNDAKVMHCLPVRRDLELSSEILDGPNSLVIHEAGNRLWAAQAVLKQMLEKL